MIRRSAPLRPAARPRAGASLLAAVAAAAVLTGAAAPAQLLTLATKDAKLLRKHAGAVLQRGEEKVFVVEPYLGVAIDERGGMTWNAHGSVSFFLGEPGDPDDVPYRVRDGRKVPRSKRVVLEIAGDLVESLDYFLPEETFETLAREHRRRRAELAALEARRDEEEEGSEAWLWRQHLVAGAAERLVDWLRAVGYTAAAEELAAEAQRAHARAGEAAAALRLARALDSVRRVDPPAELLEASEIVTEGALGFHVVESQHFRFLAIDSIEPRRLLDMARFAERALDEYRTRNLDLHGRSELASAIPPGRFQEFFFGPNEQEWFVGFLPAYFHHGWGRQAEERQKARGVQVHRPGAVHFLDYWRVAPGLSLEGVVAHEIGHVIAEYEYLGCDPEVRGDWLREGMGIYAAMHHLGRNDIACHELEPESRYGGGTAQRLELELSEQSGLRLTYLQRALACRRPLDALLRAELFEMSSGDLAKSWALVEWLLSREGERGQLWLRALGGAAGRSGTFLEHLRRHTAEIYPESADGDPLQWLEARWLSWAEAAVS